MGGLTVGESIAKFVGPNSLPRLVPSQAQADGQASRSRRRRLFLSLSGATLVSLVLLGFLLYKFGGIDRSVALALDASWTWLALSVAIYVIAAILRAWRWNLLLPSSTRPFPTLYAISSVHTMVNSLLPARVGELAFPILMRTHAATGPSRSVTLFLVGRALDLILLVFVFLIGSCVYLGVHSHPFALVLLAGLSLAGLLLLVRASPLFSYVLRRCETWFPTRRRFLEIGKRIEAELETATSSRRLFSAAMVTAAMVLTRHAFYWSILVALQSPLAFSAVIVGGTLGESTYLLPFHGVAGLGTVEAGWTVGMSLVGVSVPQALASGLFIHVWSLLLATLMGCLSLPLLRVSRQPSHAPGL